jgi:hypothetical protein
MSLVSSLRQVLGGVAAAIPKALRFYASALEQPPMPIPCGQETASQKREAFIRARHWYRYNLFVQGIVDLRLAFYNYGMVVKAESDGQPQQAGAFEEWWAARAEAVRRYVREVWLEFLVQSNVVSFWRNGTGLAMLLPLEKCEYDDTFGQERVKFRHGLTSEQIGRLDDARLQERYRRKTEIELDTAFGEHFKVLKLERVGNGLGWPALATVFAACEQMSAMEAGDRLLSEECRVLLKQHKLGHEIRTGPHAGSSVHFIKKQRAEEIEKRLKGKAGKVEITTNFDHQIEHVYLDPRFFAASKYDRVERRLIWWSSPPGQMIVTRGGVAPFLMDILRVQVLEARSLVGPYVTAVINEAFQPPARVSVEWSTRVFRDGRIAAELLKFGLTTGPLSQRTFREEADYDDEQERERKQAEAEQPDAEKLPVFDASYGTRPAAPNAKQPGRPAGTPTEG